MTRKKLIVVAWVGVPLLLTIGAAALASGYLHDLWVVHVQGDPVLEMPLRIELGPKEYGQIAEVPFVVANRGGTDLVLDQFRLTCACNGLERKVDGKYLRCEAFRLGPDEKAELRLRFGVRSPIGGQARSAVYCRTNDPARAEAALVIVIPKVTGGIVAAPNTVDFGTVATGSKPRTIVEVRDTALEPRSIKRVVSSNPKVFTARLLEAPIAPRKRDSDTEGALVGRIEVAVHGDDPGSLDGEVKIFLNGDERTPDSLPVSGRVAALVEALPSSLVLPRHSSGGPLYFGNCVCKCTTGQALRLELERGPPEVSVSVSQVKKCPSLQMVRIEWKRPVRDRSTAPEKTKITFRAWVGDRQTTLEIPVYLQLDSGK
jgi:hypothetical protein